MKCQKYGKEMVCREKHGDQLISNGQFKESENSTAPIFHENLEQLLKRTQEMEDLL